MPAFRPFIYAIALTVAFSACAHSTKSSPNETSFSQCTAEQERLREKMYAEMPEKYKTLFAGYHTVVKYYSSAPSIKELERDRIALEKENKTFDARKDSASKGLDARLLDTTPGRNRMLVSFERQRHYRFGSKPDVLLLRVDYGAPMITYRCPVENFEEKNGVWSCRLKGKITAQKALDGAPLTFSYDYRMRLIPVKDHYFFFEWQSLGDKVENDLSEDHFLLRALVYTQNEDRFYKREHPYFDPAGELSPEACAELPGT